MRSEVCSQSIRPAATNRAHPAQVPQARNARQRRRSRAPERDRPKTLALKAAATRTAVLPAAAHHGADEARERQRGVCSRVDARLVQVPNVDLNARVVRRADQPVRPRALARDVQVDVLTCAGVSSRGGAGGAAQTPARLRPSLTHPRRSACLRSDRWCEGGGGARSRRRRLAAVASGASRKEGTRVRRSRARARGALR